MSNRDYPVFLLAGQSNMAGRGSAEAIPQELLGPRSEILYDFVCSFGADRSTPTTDPGISTSESRIQVTPEGAYASNGFTRIAPCQKHPSTPGSHFGPEIGFASRMSEHLGGEPFAIIKHGRGGTNLHTDWRLEEREQGSYISDYPGRRPFRHMVEQVNARIDELRSLGKKNPYVAGFFWYQGEGDTLQNKHATQYGVRLVAFLSHVRAICGENKMPLILTEIAKGADVHPVTGRPWMIYSETVQNALARAAAADSRAEFVKTRDLQTSDLVHLDTDGLIEVGGRMADAWLRIVG